MTEQQRLKLRTDLEFNACAMVELSTVHLTEMDYNLLKTHSVAPASSAHPQVVMSHEHGYIVSAWHNFSDNPADFDIKLRELGHTESYIAILRLVHNTGATWVNFDVDASSVDGLPEFQW